MRELTIAVVMSLACAAGVVAQQAPPADTLARLEAASKALESWPGTFLLTTRAIVSKTDGSKEERSVEVMRMAGGPNGVEVTEVLSATENGKDVTEKEREKAARRRHSKRTAPAEKEQAKKESPKAEKEEEDDASLSLGIPGADNVQKYAFTGLPANGDDCGARFAPTRDHARDKDLSIGELHWSCATLDPLWVSLRLAKNPTGVSELSTRLEVARAGDVLYLARTVIDGVGGILFIKRKFHVETEISEVVPASPAAVEQAPSTR